MSRVLRLSDAVRTGWTLLRMTRLTSIITRMGPAGPPLSRLGTGDNAIAAKPSVIITHVESPGIVSVKAASR